MIITVGRRGPPPEPTKLRVLKGETRPSQLGQGEPQPRERDPEPPEWFNAEQLAVWERVVAELEAMDLAYASDQDALAVFCCAVVNYSKAQRFLSGSNVLLRKPGGEPNELYPNPVNSAVLQYAAVINRFSRDFGLTPSARAAIAQMPRREHRSDVERLLS